MPRPFPEPSINSTVDVISYANTVTDGWMTILFVIACSIIFFLMLKAKNYRTSDSFLVSLMLTMVLSSLLWAIGLLAGKIMVILLLLTVASAIYSVFDSG